MSRVFLLFSLALGLANEPRGDEATDDGEGEHTNNKDSVINDVNDDFCFVLFFEVVKVTSVVERIFIDFSHCNLYSGLFLLLVMNDLQIDIEQLYESEEILYEDP